MKARFGLKVAHIEARINRVMTASLVCIASGTYWDSYTGETSPRPPPAADKQENGQRPTVPNGKDKVTNKKKSNKKKNRRK
jgi:hypothetical protein